MIFDFFIHPLPIFIIHIVGILPWLVEIWGSVLHIRELHGDRHMSADRYAVHDSSGRTLPSER